MLLPDRYPRPRWPMRNPDVQTLYGRLMRRVPKLSYRRERVELEDGDFVDLDLDLANSDRERIAIICHGLESCSLSSYVYGAGAALKSRGWGVAAMNFRGCSGEPNRLLRSYHSGATEDLDCVVDYLIRKRAPKEIVLIGFSLGGNLVLKYVGERGGGIDPKIRASVAISTPCDLAASAARLAEPSNHFYMQRFLYYLKRKMEHRRLVYPNELDYDAIAAAQTFEKFDTFYTAPVHGFASAEDYWRKTSARAYAGNVRVPTLLLNSRDDPFLTEECHLTEIADGHRWLHAEITAHGGHVAFARPGRKEFYHDLRVAEFLSERKFD